MATNQNMNTLFDGVKVLSKAELLKLKKDIEAALAAQKEADKQKKAQKSSRAASDKPASGGNRWVQDVKAYAQRHNLSYKDAMTALSQSRKGK